jgi:tetratricopeptide (TPR) repeat protein
MLNGRSAGIHRKLGINRFDGGVIFGAAFMGQEALQFDGGMAGPARGGNRYDSAFKRFAQSAQSKSERRARVRSNKILLRAIRSWSAGDAPLTAKLALQATEEDDSNAPAFHLLAIVLDKLGHLDKALVTYEKAFALDPDDPDLPINLGLTAWQAGHLDGAERMFRLATAKQPDKPEGYNNLGCVQRDQGKPELAIETLRMAIYRLPDQPMLWNSLGSVLAEIGRAEESIVFYEEALRLNPKLASAWHNLGFVYAHLGVLDKARSAYEAALNLSKHQLEEVEIRHAHALCLAGMGELADGFAAYEIRTDRRFRASNLYHTPAPKWAGEPLEGKRLVLVGEQGLGDEIMFANTIPDAIRAAGAQGRVQVAVDKRLIPLFQRSFPAAEVGAYSEYKADGKYLRAFPWALEPQAPDFYAPLGTPLVFFRKKVADFPREAFLVPDVARRTQYRQRLAAFGPGPVIGVCWRSMLINAKRKKYYGGIESWAPILTAAGATFVNLQYGDCREELERARQELGLTIHTLGDLDLKNDIDGAAALSAACDLVISAPTAAAALAGAVGTETWFLVAGRVWPQLGTDHYPWYGKSRVFAPLAFGDWDGLAIEVRGALDDFLCAHARRAA